MMKCFIFLILLVLCLFQNCKSAPVGSYIPVFINDGYKLPRQGPIASWIQSSEWFPIEINVPDTISNVGQGISNIGQGISSGFMTLSNNFQNFIQMIPFFNRITSQVSPRPYRIFLLVPMEKNSNNPTPQIRNGGGAVYFNPFDNSMSNLIPSYP